MGQWIDDETPEAAKDSTGEPAPAPGGRSLTMRDNRPVLHVPALRTARRRPAMRCVTVSGAAGERTSAPVVTYVPFKVNRVRAAQWLDEKLTTEIARRGWWLHYDRPPHEPPAEVSSTPPEPPEPQRVYLLDTEPPSLAEIDDLNAEGMRRRLVEIAERARKVDAVSAPPPDAMITDWFVGCQNVFPYAPGSSDGLPIAGLDRWTDMDLPTWDAGITMSIMVRFRRAGSVTIMLHGDTIA